MFRYGFGDNKRCYRQNSLTSHAHASLFGCRLEKLLADVSVRLGDALRIEQADSVPRVSTEAPIRKCVHINKIFEIIKHIG